MVAASVNGDPTRVRRRRRGDRRAILRFPGDRVGRFHVQFRSSDTESYRIVGTKGDLRLEPAYNYAGELKQYLTIDGKTTGNQFGRSDQFAPQLIEFANCIREDREPEPGGLEGLADVRIVQALYQSAIERRPVALEPIRKTHRPGIEQAIVRPPVKKPKLVKVESPSGD